MLWSFYQFVFYLLLVVQGPVLVTTIDWHGPVRKLPLVIGFGFRFGFVHVDDVGAQRQGERGENRRFRAVAGHGGGLCGTKMFVF